MTPVNRVVDDHDEPALLRDQFRQLLRYRALLAVGVVVGLLGGGYLALGGEKTYTATGEVQVRSAIADPFAAGATADKGINIGSERQTAASDTVGTLAAGTLLKQGDDVTARELLIGLQVTNPPNTLTLRFSYTGATPEQSRARAEALAGAYLAHRKARTEESIENMAGGYRAQLKPLEEKRDLLEEQVGAGAAEDVTSARANIIVSISELTRKISELKALDTTPGYLNKKPVAPTRPPAPACLLLGLGGVVGLALGLLLSWVRLVFDPAVRSDRELVRSLGAPLLGTLPLGAHRRGAGCSPSAAADPGSPRSTARSPSGSPTTRRSPRAAACWSPPRARDNAEAAAAAANLAAAFAEMGRDVLLVEADLRTPTLARELGSAAHETRSPRWAADEGDGSWPTGSRSGVDVPGSGAFTLIPGTAVDNVPRALTSPPVGRIVGEADSPGTVVIVLAPPVLAYADAVALVDRVTGVMIVCDPRDVHRSDLERIREIISASGGSVLGALLHPPRRRLRARRAPPEVRLAAGPEDPTHPAHPGAGHPETTGDPAETLGLRSLTLPAPRR